MKSKIRNNKEVCEVLFEIEVPHEKIEEAFEEVYNDITKVAQIPGFRVGKAPRDMVKKHYTKDAESEVLKRVIPDSCQSAIEEHKVFPLGLPEITDIAFEHGKPLKFKARVETRPELHLKSYTGIKVEKKKPVIRDADVEKALNNLREMGAKYEPIEDRAVKMNDYIIGDLECSVDGNQIHKPRKNIWIYIEKEHVIPGLPEKIVGMKAGEERSVEITLPGNYPDKGVAGKKAVYLVRVHQIKERKLPNIDDEFAKDLGRESLAKLKEEVLLELNNQAKLSAEVEVENKILDKLTSDNVFSVPQSFVSRQLEHMVEDAKEHLIEKGFKKEELGKHDEELRKKFKDDAVKRVRVLFILDEIARVEKVEVNEKDIDEAYKVIANQHKVAPEKVREHYEKEEMVDSLAAKIREGKTIKFLIEKAEITEKEA